MFHFVYGLSQWWTGGGMAPPVATDADGALIVRVQCPLSNTRSQRVADTSGASTTFSAFGAAAGQRNHVTTVVTYNDSTTAGFLDLRDGVGGAVIATVPLPAKSGATVTFPVPLRQPTANTALAYHVSAALTTVYISVVGFQSPA